MDNGQQLVIPSNITNAGESVVFDTVVFGVNSSGGYQTNCVNIAGGTTIRITNSSFDGCQLVNSGSGNLTLVGNHHESPNAPLAPNYVVNTGTLRMIGEFFYLSTGIGNVTEFVSSSGATSSLTMESIQATSSTPNIPALVRVANGGTVKESNTLQTININTLVIQDSTCATTRCLVQVTSIDNPSSGGMILSAPSPSQINIDTTQAGPSGRFLTANTGGYYGMYSRSGNDGGWDALWKCRNAYLGNETCTFKAATGVDANTAAPAVRGNQAGSGPLLALQSGGTNKFVVANDGTPNLLGPQGKGSAPAAMGANCPAVNCSTPYTWIKVVTPDGSAAYMPVWK